MNDKDVSIVICCAGMGTRLGIGTTKALVRIHGKPLILRQLELLKDYSDIRIVVGYQAEKIIEVVTQHRKDIMFAFNYDYERTGVAESLARGSVGSRKYVVAMDGDLLVNPEDFKAFMEIPGECIGVGKPSSSEPVYVSIDEHGNTVSFKKSENPMEWMGLAKIKAQSVKSGYHHVYDLLTECLPLPAYSIRTREIDTPEDYEEMINWVDRGCVD